MCMFEPASVTLAGASPVSNGRSANERVSVCVEPEPTVSAMVTPPPTSTAAAAATASSRRRCGGLAVATEASARTLANIALMSGSGVSSAWSMSSSSPVDVDAGATISGAKRWAEVSDACATTAEISSCWQSGQLRRCSAAAITSSRLASPVNRRGRFSEMCGLVIVAPGLCT